MRTHRLIGLERGSFLNIEPLALHIAVHLGEKKVVASLVQF
jgi:hypothetical protein